MKTIIETESEGSEIIRKWENHTQNGEEECWEFGFEIAPVKRKTVEEYYEDRLVRKSSFEEISYSEPNQDAGGDVNKSPLEHLPWVDAVLGCFEDYGGEATNKQVYERIGNYVPLRETDLQITYGVPSFHHRVRWVLKTLRGQGKLITQGKGRNALLSKGVN